MAHDRIPIAGPWITQREVDYVADAAAHAWGPRANEFNARFEAAFAKYVGVKHAVSVPHCTAAIHLALAAAEIGPGDEVIVPDATWIASAAPITYVGATPVFADIDPRTWCITAAAIEACITPRTRAIIAVDLYGSMPDFDALRSLAQQRALLLIEDAAEAFGSTWRGGQAGSFGDVGVFSFHGSKTLTTHEGGMLVTDRDDLLRRVQVLRDHGRPPGDRWFMNGEVAYKYKMSSMQAAMGLAQVERADELIARKREIFGWYRERLRDTPGVTINHEPQGVCNSAWMVTAVFDASLDLTSRELMARFDAADIDTRPFFHPLSSIPACRDSPQAAAARERNHVAYDICPRGINLPSGYQMTRAMVDRVCEAVASIVDDASG